VRETAQTAGIFSPIYIIFLWEYRYLQEMHSRVIAGNALRQIMVR